MNDSPFFSIIIPTYNRSHLIEKTIQSALNQNYSSFEIIVVDDGSTDDTEKVVTEIKSEKLFYFKKENAERGAARNFGAQKARGEYLNFFDSDDLLYSHHLSSAFISISNLQKKKNFKSPEMFFLNYEIKDIYGKVLHRGKIKKGNFNKQFLNGNQLNFNCAFIQRDIALRYPFSEDRLLSGTEDWELYLRLACRFPFHYSNEITSAYINHDANSVLLSKEDALLNRSNLLIKYLSEDNVFMNVYGKHLRKIKAHMFSYTALHLSLGGKSLSGLKYLYKSFSLNFNELFKKRTFATIKILIMNCLKRH